MLKNLLTIILCFAGCCSFAQSRIYFNTGIGTYLMDDLKNFQADVASGVPVKMKDVRSFPPYVNYEAGFDVKIGTKFFVGGNAGYGSSGCRSDYQDYSGSARLDQLWKYKSIGVSGGMIQKFMNDKLLIRYELRSGFIFSNGKLSSSEIIGSQSDTDQVNVHATNIFVQPVCTVTRRFGLIGIDAYVGFNINVRDGKIYDVGDTSGAYYVFSNGTFVAVDWTGLRAGVGVSILLGK